MQWIVDLTAVETLIKSKKKVPRQIIEVLLFWVTQVEKFGLAETQKVRRFHDHPLSGQRKGERSITLSYQWRAIYSFNDLGDLKVVFVEEVTPHDYRTK